MVRDAPPQGDATLAIIEAEPRLTDRLARVFSTASGLRPVVCVPSVDKLVDRVNGVKTRLIACSADLLGELLHATDADLHDVHLVVWTRKNADGSLFKTVSQMPRLVSVIAWPDRQDFPRLWELALPVRRLAGGGASGLLQVRDVLQWEGVRREWLPRSTADLHAALDELGGRLDQLDVPRRTARRIVGVAHELLMNAMYDAPVDGSGRPLYAHDRTQWISLDPRDSPRLVLATDGLTLALQVVDRFGELRRKHVFSSIERGFRSRDPDADPGASFINTGSGGAGIGIHRIVSQANATVFEVVPKRTTSVTVLFDLDVSQRDLRTSPRSLHIFAGKAA